MDFPGLLVAWFAEWEQGSRGVQLELHQGPEDRGKRAAWLGAESSEALGSFTVWDSGELEVEVHDVARDERTHVVSTVITSTEELDEQIARFIEACQGGSATSRGVDVVNRPDPERVLAMEEYLGRVQALVIEQDWLSSAELHEVWHLIDHGEAPEGLRALAWIIADNRQRVPGRVVAEIRRYTEGVVHPDDLPSDLDRYTS